MLSQIREGQKYIAVLDLVWPYTGLILILYRKTPISILLITKLHHIIIFPRGIINFSHHIIKFVHGIIKFSHHMIKFEHHIIKFTHDIIKITHPIIKFIH